MGYSAALARRCAAHTEGTDLILAVLCGRAGRAAQENTNKQMGKATRRTNARGGGGAAACRALPKQLEK